MQGFSLFNVFIFLAAACLVVPLMSRFKLGSVIGYLLAGILIGPFGFAAVEDPEGIQHVAEFGVIMMLFLIGLEVEPKKLWGMRRAILGFGGLQVLLTSLALCGVGMALGFDWRISLAAGMGLSLSSTALVLQSLQEKNLLHTPMGEGSFAVLLFQDIAVIPILIILPLLAGIMIPADADPHIWLSGFSPLARAGITTGVIALIMIVGRYASTRLFHAVAKTQLHEFSRLRPWRW
jgi:CPA2 family monovalent cation:H+ antiporter-2